MQDGCTVELLPKLAFFALWDRPPSEGLSGIGPRDSSVGRLPIGSPPLLTPRALPSQWGPHRLMMLTPAEAQDPIDLVSDTSESAEDHSV